MNKIIAIGTIGLIIAMSLSIVNAGAVLPVDPTISLTPQTATVNIGTYHTLTAQGPFSFLRAPITFSITSGPNTGLTSTVFLDRTGAATFTYTSTTVGTDTVIATQTSGSSYASSNSVTVNWIGTTNIDDDENEVEDDDGTTNLDD